jgi:hypothetical protein
VVYKPLTFTPDYLLKRYHETLEAAYSIPNIFRRLWGTTAWKNFFYPMNFGFRQSAMGLRAQGLQVEETVESSTAIEVKA